MQYRSFGKVGYRVSALGFGCMRLPTLGKPEEIDEPQAVEMLRYAIDHGVNYIDTAYPYHGGNSERVVGKALQDGYRQRVALATKMPCWMVQQPADFDRIFAEQLQRLATDRIEFYLLHNLQAKFWQQMCQLGALEWLERKRQAAQIRYLGFSFHDSYDVFQQIIDAFDWDFCQIQYNYVADEVQAGIRGLKYAAAKNIGVVIMEPLFGGTLANPPEPIRAILDQSPLRLRPADLALRWLWNQSEISVVLSGMSSLEQVKQNVESACRSGVGALSAEEHQLIDQLRAKYKQLNPIPCTQCGYCMPCPNGVAIPDNFMLYNNGLVLGGSTQMLSRATYYFMPAEKRASQCVACRQCEALCPQGIEISQWMPRVHEELSRPVPGLTDSQSSS